MTTPTPPRDTPSETSTDGPTGTPPRREPAAPPRWLMFYGGWLTIVAAAIGGVYSLFRRSYDWTLSARALFLLSLGVGLLTQARGRGDPA